MQTAFGTAAETDPPPPMTFTIEVLKAVAPRVRQAERRACLTVCAVRGARPCVVRGDTLLQVDTACAVAVEAEAAQQKHEGNALFKAKDYEAVSAPTSCCILLSLWQAFQKGRGEDLTARARTHHHRSLAWGDAPAFAHTLMNVLTYSLRAPTRRWSATALHCSWSTSSPPLTARPSLPPGCFSCSSMH